MHRFGRLSFGFSGWLWASFFWVFRVAVALSSSGVQGDRFASRWASGVCVQVDRFPFPFEGVWNSMVGRPRATLWLFGASPVAISLVVSITGMVGCPRRAPLCLFAAPPVAVWRTTIQPAGLFVPGRSRGGLQAIDAPPYRFWAPGASI